MARPKPRKWLPKNPKKYVGDVNNIWARSSWEIRLMNWLDGNPAVLEWSSEEVIIPYVSPMDNRRHRYFPDAKITLRDRWGEIKTFLVEVKPHKETQPPNITESKSKKRLIAEVSTYGINQAKWAAAREYCDRRGWGFVVLTEYELGIK